MITNCKCVKCGNEWDDDIPYVMGVKMISVCKNCAPSKQDLERVLQEMKNL